MKKFLFSLIICFLASVSAFSADYYWVGGRGNWSDINHWRTTSGGSVLPNVIPGPTDDVYFDANSGFTTATQDHVILNVMANCRNMTFAGSSVPPTIYGSSSNELNIYGSSVWQQDMKVNVYTINYRGTGVHTIKSNGVATGSYNLNFLGTGTVNLLDDFKATRVYLQAGTLNTNNVRLDIATDFTATTGTLPRTLNLGSSEVYIINGTNFATNTALITLDAGTSHIHIMSAIGYYGYGLIARDGQKFYNVTFENPMATAAGITGNLTINRVEFKGGGYFWGNNTIEELILAPGKLYQFVSGKTQTINKRLTAGMACGGWITMKSVTDAKVSTISMPASATVDVTGVVMKDMAATGGGTFLAKSSIDQGGNVGWTFTSGEVNDLYWVGGAGDWNDSSHWATTSGGNGGACVPGPGSNVFFDAKSGFTDTSKIINVDAASYCRDITFSGSIVPPTISTSMNLNALNIYGSSVWQAGMTMSVFTVNYQDTGMPKTITSNGVAMTRDVYLLETSSVSLLDDFKGYTMYLEAGTLNTNNFKVDLSYQFSATNGNKSRTINLGSSDIYIGATTGAFRTNSSSVTLNAGTSHIHFTGKISNGYGIYGYSGQSFYDVSFEDPTSVDAKITGNLNFNRVEFKGSGSINGYCTMNELFLAPAKNYLLIESLNSQVSLTINKRLSAGAACVGWMTLGSMTAGRTAIISMPAQAIVDVAGILMSDMKATGGANFIANSSVDRGGNSGWTFPGKAENDLYWVGGAGDWNDSSHWSLSSGGVGGACVPGPYNNVFFDANSGFTVTSKTVLLNEVSAFCRDITVSGSNVPPTLASANQISPTLNIYGSSVWQSGMVMSIWTIKYQNTGLPKTITSNGVVSKISYMHFLETTSISLLDDFNTDARLTLEAGTWNTNNFRVDIGQSFLVSSTAPKTINLGSSDIYLSYGMGSFNTNSNSVTLNAGTSHIHFTGTVNGYGIQGYIGQVYHDVSFENPNAINGSISGGLTFNRAEFRGGGSFSSDNTFDKLLLLGNKVYKLQAGKTQTVKTNLTMSGTPCDVLFVQSATAGTKANLNVLAGNTVFNFVNMRDINASGLALDFKAQSTIANQNNTNVTFEPYDPGALQGLGDDWLCHVFDDNDSTSYTLSAKGFFGNEYTKYSWTKVGDPDHKGVIGTGVSVDVRKFGYGTYKVDVTYTNDGVTVTCKVSDEILIQRTASIEVDSPFEVCQQGASTKISDVTGIKGENVKWYATVTSTPELSVNTVLVDNTTYYVAQTIDGCESARVPITIKLIQCNKAVYMNPSLRLRVKP